MPAYFPAALPSLAFGIVAIGKDVLEAMNRDEKINWAKIFVSFGRGCLDGLIASKCGPAGNIIGNTILNPVEGFLKAKIDGEEYDGFDLGKDIKDGIFEGVCGEILPFIGKHQSKKFTKFVDEIKTKSKISFNDMFETFSKNIFGNKKLMKTVNTAAKTISENIFAEKSQDLIEGGAYTVCELFQKMTQDNIVLDTIIERKLFKKPDFNDEDDDENQEVISNCQKNISSDFLEKITKKIREKHEEKNIAERLRNLIKRNLKK